MNANWCAKAAVLLMLWGGSASAASAEEHVVKIGVLNDMNGPLSDSSGRGSVVAAQMAAEDYASSGGKLKVEILSADHQNKADVGAAIARRWVDVDHADAVIDLTNSAVALAVNQVMAEKDRAFLAASTATSDLTGSQCQPTTVQWTFDTWALANSTARALVRAGGTTWYFITVDYAFGQALERDAAAVVRANGGTVLGAARHPLGTPDFSSYLLQAQSSGAKVVALASAGTDVTNAIKQATEFGLTQTQKLAGLLVFSADIKGLGLAAAQGLYVTEAFYWDYDDNARAFAKRFATRFGGAMPTMNHAGVYSETLAYLRAQERAGTNSGAKVVAEMERQPIDDALFGPTVIRRDGRAVHRMMLFEVKTPAESHGPWDLYKLVATIPPADAFRPMAEGGCKLVGAQ